MPEPRVRSNGSVELARQEFFAAERRNDDKKRKAELGLSEDDELPPYVYQPYPKAMYAIGNEDSITVKNAAEEQSKLKEGWYSSLDEALAVAMSEDAEEEYATAPVGTAQPPMPKRGVGGRFLPKEE